MRNVKRSLGLFLAFGVLFLWPFSAIAAETEPVHSTDPFVTASLNAAWNDSTALVDGKISQGEYAVSQLLSVGNGLYLQSQDGVFPNKSASNERRFQLYSQSTSLSYDDSFIYVAILLSAPDLSDMVSVDHSVLGKGYQFSVMLGFPSGDNPWLRQSGLVNTYFFSETDLTCIGVTGIRSIYSDDGTARVVGKVSTLSPQEDGAVADGDPLIWSGEQYREEAKLARQKNSSEETLVFECRIPLRDVLLSVAENERASTLSNLKEGNLNFGGSFYSEICLGRKTAFNSRYTSYLFLSTCQSGGAVCPSDEGKTLREYWAEELASENILRSVDRLPCAVSFEAKPSDKTEETENGPSRLPDLDEDVPNSPSVGEIPTEGRNPSSGVDTDSPVENVPPSGGSATPDGSFVPPISGTNSTEENEQASGETAAPGGNAAPPMGETDSSEENVAPPEGGNNSSEGNAPTMEGTSASEEKSPTSNDSTGQETNTPSTDDNTSSDPSLPPPSEIDSPTVDTNKPEEESFPPALPEQNGGMKPSSSQPEIPVIPNVPEARPSVPTDDNEGTSSGFVLPPASDEAESGSFPTTEEILPSSPSDESFLENVPLPNEIPPLTNETPPLTAEDEEAFLEKVPLPDELPETTEIIYLSERSDFSVSSNIGGDDVFLGYSMLLGAAILLFCSVVGFAIILRSSASADLKKKEREQTDRKKRGTKK